MQENYQGNFQGNYQGNYSQGQAFNQGAAGMDYTVDMVFCIDATLSMEAPADGEKKIINMVKENALNFYDDLTGKLLQKNKNIRQLRIRVIAFRDYLADGENAMLATDFFLLPQQAKEFEDCIHSICANGGGDIPEDGLEALSYAIRSDWTTEGAKKRQVIVVWTDASTHDLQFGAGSPYYPGGLPKNMGELNDWYEMYMHPNYKRLVLFAPDEPGWSYISQNWDNVIHYPSVAGNGLAEQTYGNIIDVLVNSIGSGL